VEASVVPDQIAVVTGGASGMGRIHALRMAKSGTRVAVLDRTSSALEELAAQSANIIPYTCDVTDAGELQAIIQSLATEFGPIVKLVHCAAIFPTGRLDTQEQDSIHQLMHVNYGGTVNAVRAVLPGMQARNSGEIVIYGSIGGAVPVPDCGAYCASKAAVNLFAEVLIEENRENAVHILLVCPPLVDTPLLQQATDTGNPKMVRDSISSQRFAKPETIVDDAEKALASGKTILYPRADAKVMAWLRRFSPRLVWGILRSASKPDGAEA
jgi:short-subunit dehydrogenase